MIDQPTDAVVARLREHFASYRPAMAARGAHAAALWDALEEATGGGKLLRPGLVLVACRALGGSVDAGAVQVAAAYELLHTSFLVHDDVIDNDLVRRGRPNVAGTFQMRAVDHATAASAPLWGLTAGVLAGDLALSHAQRLVATAPLEAGLRDRLLDVFDAAIVTTAAGELGDVVNAGHHALVDLDDLIAVEADKTAAYSFEAPLATGAILAGASDRIVARLAAVGRSLGIAFQLADDLLGVFGDEAETGKSTVGDLREGKTTPIILHARSTSFWSEIAPYVGRADLTEREADAVRALLERAGSRAWVERLARQHGERAAALLADPDVPRTLGDALLPLADAALERTR